MRCVIAIAAAVTAGSALASGLAVAPLPVLTHHWTTDLDWAGIEDSESLELLPKTRR
jgi:hypothetical protein